MWRTEFNAKRFVSGTVFVMSIVLLSAYSSSGQNQRWREIQGHPLTKFDWNCALPSTYPQSKLARAVKDVLEHERDAEDIPDRAFPFDLNQDGKPEYFVPLFCGAVGNCDWGVFAVSPTRFLGKVNGQYLCAQTSGQMAGDTDVWALGRNGRRSWNLRFCPRAISNVR